MSGGRDLLDCFLGSWYLVLYFQMLGAKIGSNVCLYPNGADPMMTEPELVTIGENASIDSAMLIAHLNTKGTFTLGPLYVEANCVMRPWARLQQGATMQSDIGDCSRWTQYPIAPRCDAIALKLRVLMLPIFSSGSAQ